MRIAVMGAGGTGGFFGGVLARAGEDVTFIARGAHLEAIQRNGLQLRSPLAGDFIVDAPATDNPASIGTVDFVLFSVKMYDSESAAEKIRPLIGPETLVASTQNGVDGEQLIGSLIGQDHVLGATATVSSIIAEPGVVDHQGGPGTLLLGEMSGGTSARVQKLVSVLKASGIKADVHRDIRTAIWQKFMFICGLSGITALTRLPIGTILANSKSSELLLDSMLEVVEVAQKAGVLLSPANAEGAIPMLRNVEARVKGSMAHDLEAGRKLELEYLNGKVVALGQEFGVSTPVNSIISSALAPFTDGAPANP